MSTTDSVNIQEEEEEQQQQQQVLAITNDLMTALNHTENTTTVNTLLGSQNVEMIDSFNCFLESGGTSEIIEELLVPTADVSTSSITEEYSQHNFNCRVGLRKMDDSTIEKYLKQKKLIVKLPLVNLSSGVQGQKKSVEKKKKKQKSRLLRAYLLNPTRIRLQAASSRSRKRSYSSDSDFVSTKPKRKSSGSYFSSKKSEKNSTDTSDGEDKENFLDLD